VCSMRSIQQDGTDSASGARGNQTPRVPSDVSLIRVIHRIKRIFVFREIVFA
jgi:hypothetical protein